MSPNYKVLVPVVAGLMLAGTVQAQLLPTWETHITLTQQDLDMIHAVVTDQVHSKPVGMKVSWSNPVSGNSGYVKLNKRLVRSGQRCEGIGYTVWSKGPPVYTEHYYFISGLSIGRHLENRVSPAQRGFCNGSALKQEIVAILEGANGMTIATIREDGYPQATTVSYVNDGLTIYFWLRGRFPKGQKPRPRPQGLAHSQSVLRKLERYSWAVDRRQEGAGDRPASGRASGSAHV